MDDIDSNILSLLRNQGYYKIKSNVSKKVFLSFLSYWINEEIPEFDDDNITEYDQLSQEFDLMKNLVQIYKQIQVNNKNLALQQKRTELKGEYIFLSEIKKNKIQKYQQIIKILYNCNAINSISKFLEIKNQLLDSCKYENIKKLKKLTQKTVIYGGLTYVLNEDTKTAKIINGLSKQKSVYIPKIIHKNDEIYTVTEMTENSNDFLTSLRTVSFPYDSCVRVIGSSVFFGSKIKSFKIPASVEKLEDGWYYGLDNLIEIKIDPNNKNFKLYNDDLILEKSDPQSKIFDTLIFARRNIEKAQIPSFIKSIEKHAFDSCNKLKEIIFDENSQLQIINDFAFLMCSVESISLPSSVIVFKDEWCSRVNKLNNIKINNSDQINITYFDDKFILGKSDLYSDVFDVIIFARRDIENATIPSFIKIIGSNSFAFCQNLKQVQFPFDSKIELIEQSAFSGSSIESIFIPSTVKKIKKKAFSECGNLTEIKFDLNSQLKEIGKFLFGMSSIENITIPSQIKKIKENTFMDCNIKNLDFQENSKLEMICDNAFNMEAENISIPSSVVLSIDWCKKLESIKNINIVYKDQINIKYYDDKFIIGKSNSYSDVYDVLLFARRDIENATIPSFIKIIGSCAFYNCKQLKLVNFCPDSQLKTIYNEAFSYSSLNDISLPSTVTDIYYSAFSYCEQLKHFKFPENQNFTTIPAFLLFNSAIENIKIPSNVTSINTNAFALSKITSITFDNDSKLKEIDDNAFISCKNLRKIHIPSNVTNIKKKSFLNCEKLEKVLFKDDSKLEIIDKSAFVGTLISSISLPKNTIYVSSFAFNSSNGLQIMEIQEKTKLHSINKNVSIPPLFSHKKDFILMVPANFKIVLYNSFLDEEK